MTSYTWAFVGLVVAFSLVRGSFDRWALFTRGPVAYSQKMAVTVWQVGGAVVGFLLMLAYLFAPHVLAWATLPLPGWARWSGLGVGIVGLGLLAWSHVALGRNFSGTIIVRQAHELVTWGPYQYVRHPMYTTLYLFDIAFTLLGANWFVGLYGFVFLTAVIAPRLPQEEAALRTHFGEQYDHYVAHTGRLLPHL